MEKIIEQMKTLLASSFSFYLKIHNFHWNVEGSNFHSYHAYFGELYTEIWGSIDLIAEQIRALDAYCPGSLSRFSELSVIKDQINIPLPNLMFKELLIDNEKLIVLMETIDASLGNTNKGLGNFLQARIEIHKKHSWMLKAMSKQNG